MWPIRTIIFFSFAMLALQGIVKFAEAMSEKGEEEEK
jgi:TRAP-type mannitol/chloroaromatic compound transport system permease small subunit